MSLGLKLAKWGAAGDSAFQCCWRTLTFGQAVYAVVHYHGADIQVPGRLRADMLATDAEEVAVAGHHDHIQRWLGHLDAQSDGE